MLKWATKGNRWTTAFCLLASTIVLLEGLGLPWGRATAFYLLLLTPIILFGIDLSQKKLIQVNKFLFVCILVYLLTLFISFLTSVNYQNAWEALLLKTALFLIFLNLTNHQEQLKRSLLIALVGISFILSLYSLLLQTPGITRFTNLIPRDGYNLVYPNYGHNHLGDISMLVLIVAIIRYTQTKRLFYLIISIYFLPFFLLSFSRSAYVALIASLLITSIFVLIKRKIHLNWWIGIFSSILIISSFILVLATTKQASYWQPTKSVYQFLLQNTNLDDKSFLSKRDELAQQALDSFREHPWLGLGSGNFTYASLKHSHIFGYYSDTSHNIFLDSLVETGVIGTTALLMVLIIILFARRVNLYTLLAVALLVLFQTDYIFNLYSISLLFFSFLALHYQKPDKQWSPPKLVWSILLVLLSLSIVTMMLGNFLVSRKNYTIAFYVYPWNKALYEKVIPETIIKSSDKADVWLNRFNYFFSREPNSRIAFGYRYFLQRNNLKALELYQEAYAQMPNQQPDMITKNVILLTRVKGNEEAIKFLRQAFYTIGSLKNRKYVNDTYRRRLLNACYRTKEPRCFQDYVEAIHDY